MIQKKTLIALAAVVFGLIVQAQEWPKVEFQEAVQVGLLVHWRAISPGGLGFIDLELEAKEPIVIVIPAGTVFSAQDEGTQSLITVKELEVALKPGAKQTVSVPVVCYEMELNDPEEGMSFVGVGNTTNPHLILLLKSPTFEEETFRIKQFAVWTILERPRSRYDYCGLSLGTDVVEVWEALGLPIEVLALLYSVPELIYELSEDELAALELAFTIVGIPVENEEELYDLFAIGVPTKGELIRIRELFKAAGIPVLEYPVLSSLGKETFGLERGFRGRV